MGAEELPISHTGSFRDRFDPPGDLRFRQPEHLLATVNAHRLADVQGLHGGGGLTATTAPAASTSVLERITVMPPLPSSQRWMSPQVRDEASDRLNPPSESTATSATLNLARSAAAKAEAVWR